MPPPTTDTSVHFDISSTNDWNSIQKDIPYIEF